MKPANWYTHSWQHYANAQDIQYDNPSELHAILNSLRSAPGFIHPQSLKTLQRQLAKAAQGQAFFIQAGDCAEAFNACAPRRISKQIQLLEQLRSHLAKTLQQPVFVIGRIAGQYAKPRTNLTETQDQLTLPSYRGDLINGTDFTERSRRPNPYRLRHGYYKARFTFDYLKKHKANLYTSHEALHLPFEAALTRQLKHPGPAQYFNAAAHLLWVGMRTAQPNSAHIEFLRGLMNPIGIKVGPNHTPSALVKLCQQLNPNNIPGRVVFISRLGLAHIEAHLPQHLRALQNSGLSAVWACDPMHGNTKIEKTNRKIRAFEDIWQELKISSDIHQAHQSHLAGIHLEITPELVYECSGGIEKTKRTHPKPQNRHYKSLMDPRLNAEQAQSLIHHFGEMISK